MLTLFQSHRQRHCSSPAGDGRGSLVDLENTTLMVSARDTDEYERSFNNEMIHPELWARLTCQMLLADSGISL